jgi:hypothetical protein
VQARDLRVPRQAHVVRLPAADAQPLAAGVERDDPLRAPVVAEHEERAPAPLGLDALAQLLGRRAVRPDG